MLMLVYFYYYLISCSVVFANWVHCGGFRNLPTVTFEEGYSQIFGGDNLRVVDDGHTVQLSLDRTTGSGFISIESYHNGLFSASIKLPANYSAGVVVAFYMSNYDNDRGNHDEIDFELLGNIKGQPWKLQTNIYANGSTNFGREERYDLSWFDPCQEFHRYTIIWNHFQIVFYVDDVPIREIKRTDEMGGSDYPSKPMSVYATIWDASSWATSGGEYPVDYNYSPFVAHLTNLTLLGSQYHRDNGSSVDVPTGIMGPSEWLKMASFRSKHMTYSYCYDRKRYKVAPLECATESQETKEDGGHIIRYAPAPLELAPQPSLETARASRLLRLDLILGIFIIMLVILFQFI